jgi:hypothetical protein
VRIGRDAQEQERNPDRKSVLECSIPEYADRKAGLVVNPTIGISFDTIQEAYDFHNLYSVVDGIQR